MNRIDRLTAILILLQTKRLVRGREIAERYGISLRTVYRDIRALEDAGVPIGSEAGLGYFLAKGYHLPPVMFTQAEADALLIAGKLMARFADMGADYQYAAALDKIKAVLGAEEKDRMDRLGSLIEVLKASPGRRDGFPNDVLLKIQTILGKNKVLQISYHSGYKDEITHRAIEPLGLCFYATHWHLIAFCRLRRDYRDFRVDRIKQLTDTGETFDRRLHAGLQTLIRKVVQNSDLKPATLRFSRRSAQFIQDQKHYFGFVDETEVDGQVEMHFLVSSYDYLARWVLGFVDQVIVMAPDSLRKRLVDFCRRLATHYGGHSPPNRFID